MAFTQAMNLLGSGVSSSFFKRATAILSLSLAALDHGSCGREGRGPSGQRNDEKNVVTPQEIRIRRKRTRKCIKNESIE